MKLLIATNVPAVIFFIFFFNIIFCEEVNKNSDSVTNSSDNNIINISGEYNITTKIENLDVIIKRNKNTDQSQLIEYVENKKEDQKSINVDFQNDITIVNNVTNDHQENGIKKNHNQQDSLSFRDILINLMLPNFKGDAVEKNSVRNIDVNNIIKDGFEKLEKNVSVIEMSSQLNITEAEGLNNTVGNSTASNNTTSKKCFCVDIDNREEIGDVEIINSTTLQSLLIHDANISSRSVPSSCYLIYFFSPYCPFSAQGSAYVNALARSLKHVPIYGLDSIMFHSMNARYGVMGTPSLILFHNGNVVARYNASEYSTFHLEAFIHHFSNQVPESINVTSHDFKALLPSKVIASSPFALYIAWVFLITCGGWVFFNSEFYAKLNEAVLNNWREAEAQHAHDD